MVLLQLLLIIFDCAVYILERFLTANFLCQVLMTTEYNYHQCSVQSRKIKQRSCFPLFCQEVVKASQLVDPNTLLHQAAVYTCKQQGVKVQLPVYK